MGNQSITNDMFGLNSATISTIKKIFSDEFKTKTYRVYVFGSRATGRHKKYSDLDLWVEAQPSLTDDKTSRLREKFENSDLAIKIDLITPETCLEEYKARVKAELVRFI